MNNNLDKNIYENKGIKPSFSDHELYSQELKKGDHNQVNDILKKSFDNIFLENKRVDRNSIENLFKNLTNEEMKKLVLNRAIEEKDSKNIAIKLNDDVYQASNLLECLYKIQFNIEKNLLNQPSDLYKIYSNYAEPFKTIIVEVRIGILKHSIKKSKRN
jgi:hypothetical protein